MFLAAARSSGTTPRDHQGQTPSYQVFQWAELAPSFGARSSDPPPSCTPSEDARATTLPPLRRLVKIHRKGGDKTREERRAEGLYRTGDGRVWQVPRSDRQLLRRHLRRLKRLGIQAAVFADRARRQRYALRHHHCPLLGRAFQPKTGSLLVFDSQMDRILTPFALARGPQAR